jgi:Uma2 family endonuclease
MMNLREILAADRVREASLPRDVDQRVVLHDVSWQDFELLLAMRGDRAGVRVTYLEGELELMSPSQSHESIKTTIARILEAYVLERGIDIGGYGSWTLKNVAKERALEPDECYIVGSAPKTQPDLAIEVIWTSGGLDKLEVYRGLGVQEVWVWRANQIQVYELRSEQYQRIEQSTLFPDFDLDTVARCISEAESQTKAVITALAALRERSA